MYRMDILLSLILLVSEMLKIPKTKIEAHFLKKTDFVNSKCLAQEAFEKCPSTTENLSKHTALQFSQYMVISQIFLLSHVFYKPNPVSELNRLMRCIAHIISS